MWQARWKHKITGAVFTESGYDLYDLERELTKLRNSGHTVISGPYPVFED
jgi:hypothetical protein